MHHSTRAVKLKHLMSKYELTEGNQMARFHNNTSSLQMHVIARVSESPNPSTILTHNDT